MKKQHIIVSIIALLLIGAGFFALQKNQGSAPKENVNTSMAPAEESPSEQAQPQPQETVTSSAKNEPSVAEKNSAGKSARSQKKISAQQPSEQKNPATALSQKAAKDMTENELLAALQDAGKKEQYVKFADVLSEVYTRKIEKKDDFQKAESAAYVKATDYLDKEKNVQKALDTADMVYKKVPFGWRFKYLRVRALEALGREAFDTGDLTKAQEYAYTILQMEFRPEGANLMGDIFIKKIETALAKGDTQAARNAYEEIKDYEISADRGAKLAELGKKL